MATPELSKITKHPGIAGQVSYSVEVTYKDIPGAAEETSTIEFVGSTYGGPVVMVTAGGQTFVTEPGRFGPFGEDWVRKFFS